ncbi:MAG: response regulator [bacterium]|nr:response regulator [bacterium]
MNRPIRILVVEDDPVDAMTLERAVRRRALDVELDLVESAEAALDRLRCGQETGSPNAERPQLILADLRLPRLSGLDLLERVKADEAVRRIPFVLLSTSIQDLDVAAAYALGAAGYFSKSVDFDDFADTVAAIVAFVGRAVLLSPQANVPWSSSLPGRSTSHYLEGELVALIREDPRTFDFIQNGATDGLWYWDLEQPENEWMSSGFWTTFGFDPATKPHLTAAWQELIDATDLEVSRANFEKHCEDPAHPYDQVIRCRHRDGHTVWVHCHGIAIRDREGKPVRMLGAHRDVTAREVARRRAEDAEARLRAIASVLDETDETQASPRDARLRAILAAGPAD